MVRRSGVGLIRGIVLWRGIHCRYGRGNQLPRLRDVGFAGGAREQAVVADAVEPFGQDVEQKAPDELVRRSVIVRYRACPLWR